MGTSEDIFLSDNATLELIIVEDRRLRRGIVQYHTLSFNSRHRKSGRIMWLRLLSEIIKFRYIAWHSINYELFRLWACRCYLDNTVFNFTEMSVPCICIVLIYVVGGFINILVQSLLAWYLVYLLQTEKRKSNVSAF